MRFAFIEVCLANVCLLCSLWLGGDPWLTGAGLFGLGMGVFIAAVETIDERKKV